MAPVDQNASSTMYPLGKDVFASVRTWKGIVKIHVRHYTAPINGKEGRRLPTQKGVAMDSQQFQNLLRVHKKLATDYRRQTENLPDTKRPKKLRIDDDEEEKDDDVFFPDNPTV